MKTIVAAGRAAIGLGTALVVALAMGCGEQQPTSASDGEAPAAAAVPGPVLQWDVSLWGKPRAGTVVADALAAAIEAETGGNWRLTLHYGGCPPNRASEETAG